MTKFGEYLDAQATPAWRDHYVRYKYLKGILKSIVSRNEEARTNARSGFDTPLGPLPPKDLAHLSLTFQEVRPGSKPGETAEGETAFFKVLEEDVEKVRTFVEDSLAALKRASRSSTSTFTRRTVRAFLISPPAEPAATPTSSSTPPAPPRTAMITSAWTSRPIPRSTVALSRRLRISATHSTLCKMTFCASRSLPISTPPPCTRSSRSTTSSSPRRHAAAITSSDFTTNPGFAKITALCSWSRYPISSRCSEGR